MDKETLECFLPTSFGGSGAEFDLAAQMETARRNVPGGPEPKATASTSSKDDSDSDEDSDEDSEDGDEYPISHEIVFKTHDRPVTTITVDASGSRMITGSTDCTI